MENSYQNQPQNKDIFNDQPRTGLPGMLNVLTILTFIGCAISYIMLVVSLVTNKNPAEQQAELEEMQDQMEGSGMEGFAQGAMDMAQKTWDYRYILLVSGLLFTTMCLIGAMQMRKLKKSGFLIYTIGELAPIIITAALIGFSMVGGIMTAISSVFAILFVILYATQRKYLVN